MAQQPPSAKFVLGSSDAIYGLGSGVALALDMDPSSACMEQVNGLLYINLPAEDFILGPCPVFMTWFCADLAEAGTIAVAAASLPDFDYHGIVVSGAIVNITIQQQTSGMESGLTPYFILSLVGVAALDNFPAVNMDVSLSLNATCGSAGCDQFAAAVNVSGTIGNPDALTGGDGVAMRVKGRFAWPCPSSGKVDVAGLLVANLASNGFSPDPVYTTVKWFCGANTSQPGTLLTALARVDAITFGGFNLNDIMVRVQVGLAYVCGSGLCASSDASNQQLVHDLRFSFVGTAIIQLGPVSASMMVDINAICTMLACLEFDARGQIALQVGSPGVANGSSSGVELLVNASASLPCTQPIVLYGELHVNLSNSNIIADTEARVTWYCSPDVQEIPGIALAAAGHITTLSVFGFAARSVQVDVLVGSLGSGDGSHSFVTTNVTCNVAVNVAGQSMDLAMAAFHSWPACSTPGCLNFTASLQLDATFGDPAAINSGNGVALVVNASLALPCDATETADAVLYINEGDFTTTIGVSLLLFCVDGAPSWLIATAAVPQLVYDGVSVTDASLVAQIAPAMDVDGVTRVFIAYNFSGAASMDVLGVSASLNPLTISANCSVLGCQNTFFVTAQLYTTFGAWTDVLEGNDPGGVGLYLASSLQYPCYSYEQFTGELIVFLPRDDFAPEPMILSGWLQCFAKNTVGYANGSATLSSLVFQGLTLTNVSLDFQIAPDSTGTFRTAFMFRGIGSIAFAGQSLTLSAAINDTWPACAGCAGLSATLQLASTFGTAGAVGGSASGWALVVDGALAYPCISETLVGSLYINEDNFAPSPISARLQVGCEGGMPSSFAASATVESLTYGALSLYSVHALLVEVKNMSTGVSAINFTLSGEAALNFAGQSLMLNVTVADSFPSQPGLPWSATALLVEQFGDREGVSAGLSSGVALLLTAKLAFPWQCSSEPEAIFDGKLWLNLPSVNLQLEIDIGGQIFCTDTTNLGVAATAYANVPHLQWAPSSGVELTMTDIRAHATLGTYLSVGGANTSNTNLGNLTNNTHIATMNETHLLQYVAMDLAGEVQLVVAGQEVGSLVNVFANCTIGIGCRDIIASAHLSLLFGDAGVVDYTQMGIAVQVEADVVYPCVGSTHLMGTVYVQLPLLVMAPLDVSLIWMCDQSAPGVSATAFTTLDSLAVPALGLVIEGLDVGLTMGSYNTSGSIEQYSDFRIRGTVILPELNNAAMTVTVNSTVDLYGSRSTVGNGEISVHFGNAAVASGAASGYALELNVSTPLPCLSSRHANGMLYVNESSYGFVLDAMTVSVEWFCAQPVRLSSPVSSCDTDSRLRFQSAAESTTLIATGSLESLAFAGLSFKNITASYTAGYCTGGVSCNSVSVSGQLLTTHLSLTLLADIREVDGSMTFSTSAMATGLFGRPGVLDGSASGVALSFGASVSYPCLSSWLISGTLYINLPQNSFLPHLLSVADEYFCHQSDASQVDNVATVTLPSLKLGVLTFTNVSGRLVSGHVLDSDGHLHSYDNLTLTSALTLDDTVVQLTVHVNETDSQVYFSAETHILFSFGDPLVALGHAQGIALSLEADLDYANGNCSAPAIASGNLYVNKSSWGLAFVAGVYGTRFCPSDLPGVSSIVTATVPLLRFAGLGISASVTVVSGTQLAADGIVLVSYQTMQISAVSMIGSVSVAVDIFIYLASGSSNISVTANMLYSEQFMGSGTAFLNVSLGVLGLGTSDMSYVGAGNLALTGLPHGLPSVNIICDVAAAGDFKQWRVGCIDSLPWSFDVGDGHVFVLPSPMLNMTYDSAVAQRFNFTLTAPLGTGEIFVQTSLPFNGVLIAARFSKVQLTDVCNSLSTSMPSSGNISTPAAPGGFFSPLHNLLAAPFLSNLSITFVISATPAISMRGHLVLLGVDTSFSAMVFRTGTSGWSFALTFQVDIERVGSLSIPGHLTMTQLVQDAIGAIDDALSDVLFTVSTADLSDPAILNMIDTRTAVSGISRGFHLVFLPIGQPAFLQQFLQHLTGPRDALSFMAPYLSPVYPPISASLSGTGLRVALKVVVPKGVNLLGMSLYELDVYFGLSVTVPSISAGLGMTIQVNNDILATGDFEFTISPFSLSIFALVSVMRNSTWMNPFGISTQAGITFPLAFGMGITFSWAPPAVVPSQLILQGGLIAPAGLSQRYPAAAGDMSFSTLVSMNLDDPLKSAFSVTASNLALGRMLYVLGLYTFDGPCVKSQATCVVPKSASSFPMSIIHPFLDVLDMLRAGYVKASVNMGSDEFCKNGVCIPPGIHLLLQNVSFFGLVNVDTLEFSFVRSGAHFSLSATIAIDTFSIGGGLLTIGPSLHAIAASRQPSSHTRTYYPWEKSLCPDTYTIAGSLPLVSARKFSSVGGCMSACDLIGCTAFTVFQDGSGVVNCWLVNSTSCNPAPA
jgi:hypothetical protein